MRFQPCYTTWSLLVLRVRIHTLRSIFWIDTIEDKEGTAQRMDPVLVWIWFFCTRLRWWWTEVVPKFRCTRDMIPCWISTFYHRYCGVVFEISFWRICVVGVIRQSVFWHDDIMHLYMKYTSPYMIGYSRICINYHDIHGKKGLLPRKILNQVCDRCKSWSHPFVNFTAAIRSWPIWNICFIDANGYVPIVVNFPFYPIVTCLRILINGFEQTWSNITLQEH